MKSNFWTDPRDGRRYFIGGSDARIIMGNDDGALLRLWREKRGEAEPEDLSGNLIVQLGVATEALNWHWRGGRPTRDRSSRQRHVKHASLGWMVATLDWGARGQGWCSRPRSSALVLSRRRRLPTRQAALSVISGDGKWVEITANADPLYQHLIVTAERKFWRLRGETGKRPRGAAKARIEAVRIVDMRPPNRTRKTIAIS